MGYYFENDDILDENTRATLTQKNVPNFHSNIELFLYFDYVRLITIVFRINLLQLSWKKRGSGSTSSQAIVIVRFALKLCNKYFKTQFQQKLGQRTAILGQ